MSTIFELTAKSIQEAHEAHKASLARSAQYYLEMGDSYMNVASKHESNSGKSANEAEASKYYAVGNRLLTLSRQP